MVSLKEMDIRQLSALLAVADHGTFSAAADALHTVQSNISSHVASLEKELGTPLIDRGQGQLTEEGEAVAHRARRVLNELSAVKADVAALRNEVIGEVRLGLIGTTARWLVPEVMEIMGERYPNAQIVIREGVTSQLAPQLTSGSIDMAVMILPAVGPDIATHVLFEEDMLLVVPGDHPLAGRAKHHTGRVERHTPTFAAQRNSCARRARQRSRQGRQRLDSQGRNRRRAAHGFAYFRRPRPGHPPGHCVARLLARPVELDQR